METGSTAIKCIFSKDLTLHSSSIFFSIYSINIHVLTFSYVALISLFLEALDSLRSYTHTQRLPVKGWLYWKKILRAPTLLIPQLIITIIHLVFWFMPNSRAAPQKTNNRISNVDELVYDAEVIFFNCSNRKLSVRGRGQRGGTTKDVNTHNLCRVDTRTNNL